MVVLEVIDADEESVGEFIILDGFLLYQGYSSYSAAGDGVSIFCVGVNGCEN